MTENSSPSAAAAPSCPAPCPTPPNRSTAPPPNSPSPPSGAGGRSYKRISGSLRNSASKMAVFMFWNTAGKTHYGEIRQICRDHDVDVVIFAESQLDPTTLVTTLNL